MISNAKNLVLYKNTDVKYGFVFKEYPSVELLGYNKHPYKNYNVHYIKCFECAKDPELFGDAIFWATLSDLKRGQMACGCARLVKWTKSQWEILARRTSQEMGFTFQGWSSDTFTGATTKCRILCSKHGTWETTTASNLIKLKRGCPKCGNESKAVDRKPHKNAVTDKEFFSTGKYHPDTVFKRIGQRDGKGSVYWSVDCPLCGIIGEAQADALKRGVCCCGCNNSGNQNTAYINIIQDKDTPIALKFGVTCDIDRRKREQSSGCIYDVINTHVFHFMDRDMCRAAEKKCKTSLFCGVIPRNEMKNGFSETTYLSNLENIIQIFTTYGGVEL